MKSSGFLWEVTSEPPESMWPGAQPAGAWLGRLGIWSFYKVWAGAVGRVWGWGGIAVWGEAQGPQPGRTPPSPVPGQQ